MQVIYVSDASDVVKHIRNNHFSGNIEASALRLHAAQEMGFQIARTKRPSGSWMVRIDLPNPQVGEAKIDAYLQGGVWKFVLCTTHEEAHDFQWFVIERLKPFLNRERKTWDTSKRDRYQKLLDELSTSASLPGFQLRGRRSGPGVYVLYHKDHPMPEQTTPLQP
jgi:hypothetical protein